ncbi:MAG: YgiQ family radical SAM protein, partial [Desulfobulbaceae bacterium]|nr:YgiQ family radical SAM protein [Desulfobulbaceae bacterium]
MNPNLPPAPVPPPAMNRTFLPATRDEMTALGWETVDVVLVTGDAYIDHPSFGVALIGRWLTAHGYRVAVLAQPRHDGPDDFLRFGTPRLFFGITSGNLDSIVANYSGNAKVRDRDDFSPKGNPYFGAVRTKEERRRPDRAVIRYANLARAAARDTPIVLGGLEASLRRFVHYDYQQAKLRQSALADAKADLLVCGMGERAVVEIARRLDQGGDLASIPGTCERLTDRQLAERGLSEPLELPDWAAINLDGARFLEAENLIDRQARALSPKPLIQRQQAVWIVQHRPAAPLTTEELDRLYSLPYCRAPHPTAGRVPAYEMIRHSLTIVRGCCGNCSFCAITRHQGPVVTSRSRESVLAEAAQVAAMEDFQGTISDLGGPTANLYGTSCKQSASCKRHDCLYPTTCPQLEIHEEALVTLLAEVAALPGVKHLFVSSGLRMELLLKTPTLLRALLRHHTPGAMKIA